jgi:hypothetical protein
MNRLLPLSRPLLRKGRSRAELALLLIAFSWSYAHAQAVNPNIVLGNPCGVQPQMPQITYAAKPGEWGDFRHQCAKYSVLGTLTTNGMCWDRGHDPVRRR